MAFTQNALELAIEKANAQMAARGAMVWSVDDDRTYRVELARLSGEPFDVKPWDAEVSVSPSVQDELDRWLVGKAYLLRQLARPEIASKIDHAKATNALRESHLLCLTAFVFGIAFYTCDRDDEDLRARLMDLEAAAAFSQWVVASYHQGLANVPLYPLCRSTDLDPREPDHSNDFAEHELFATFRAGARYAATGSPFRKANAWSVPAARQQPTFGVAQ